MDDKKLERIKLLQEEIKELKIKEELLQILITEYYDDYFNMKRDDDHLLLTDIPKNPNRKKHVLWDYSALNIDVIGKIICDLFKKYENKNMISERNSRVNSLDIMEPFLTISNTNEEDKADNIIITYDYNNGLDKYPTDNPVIWRLNKFAPLVEGSNYDNLIGYHDGLIFDYKNKEYIKELIYSLSYYQKIHDIYMMNEQETLNAYKKIFKNQFLF